MQIPTIASSNSSTEHIDREVLPENRRGRPGSSTNQAQIFSRESNSELKTHTGKKKESRYKKTNEIEEEDRRPILGFEIPIYFKTSKTPPPNREIWCRRRTLSILLLFKQTEIPEF